MGLDPQIPATEPGMDTEDILDRLVDAGVLRSSGDRVSLAEQFQRRRAEIAAEMGEPDRRAWLAETGVDREAIDEDAVVDAATIDEFVEDVDGRETLAAASALERIENPPNATGAPDGFVPLHQEDLPAFLRRHRASVVFVWKEGSPSCEEMAGTLGELEGLAVVDETVGLGSICVDDGADLLRKRYDVGLLPTTLFFVGEAVDSRFVFPRGLKSVQREVEIITDETAAG